MTAIAALPPRDADGFLLDRADWNEQVATALAREDDKVVLVCPNRLQCPAQRQAAIEFFAGRGQLNIDGLGEKLVAQLLATGLVADVADLFDLTAPQLAALERFGELSAKNLVAALAKAKADATASRLIAALGIPHVGGVVAKAIAGRYRRLSALVAAADATSSEALVEALTAIEGVGEVIARAVDGFVRDPHARAVIDKLIARGVDPEEPVAAVVEGPLTGKTLCVTGTLSVPRGQVEARIVAAGGKLAGSVTPSTCGMISPAFSISTRSPSPMPSRAT